MNLVQNWGRQKLGIKSFQEIQLLLEATGQIGKTLTTWPRG